MTEVCLDTGQRHFRFGRFDRSRFPGQEREGRKWNQTQRKRSYVVPGNAAITCALNETKIKIMELFRSRRSLHDKEESRQRDPTLAVRPFYSFACLPLSARRNFESRRVWIDDAKALHEPTGRRAPSLHDKP